MTDGILINEMMQDPLLSKYSVIMIDDIHERTINSDIVLALLKKIRNKRQDLKLIVSSATLDAEKISNYFTNTDKKLFSNILYV
jgi:ATP-dependent RNA helicase DDX35